MKVLGTNIFPQKSYSLTLNKMDVPSGPGIFFFFLWDMREKIGSEGNKKFFNDPKIITMALIKSELE